MDRIKTVVEQGAGIVKAMLGFSRDSGQQPGPCDLNAVVADTLKLLGDRFLREVQISFERAPGPARAGLLQGLHPADPAELHLQRRRIHDQTQAASSWPRGSWTSCRPIWCWRPRRPAAYVAISVRDFGCGIPPENMPRIFEPFFTTKALSVRRGTGLGLSMVYELAKKMEAGLAVESVVDQGSAFTLILPVTDMSAEQQPAL